MLSNQHQAMHRIVAIHISLSTNRNDFSVTGDHAPIPLVIRRRLKNFELHRISLKKGVNNRNIVQHFNYQNAKVPA